MREPDGSRNEPQIGGHPILNRVADHFGEGLVDVDETVQRVGEECRRGKEVKGERYLLEPLARRRWGMWNATY